LIWDNSFHPECWHTDVDLDDSPLLYANKNGVSLVDAFDGPIGP